MLNEAMNTIRSGPRPTFVPSGLLIHQALWSQRTWAQDWGPLCPLLGMGAQLRPHLAQYGLGRGLPPYQVASCSMQPFGHNRQWADNCGALSPFWGKESWVSIENNVECRVGRGLPPYQVAS